MSYNTHVNYATFVIYDEAIVGNEMDFVDVVMEECIMSDVLHSHHMTGGCESKMLQSLSHAVKSYVYGYPDNKVKDITRWSQELLSHVDWIELASNVQDVILEDGQVWDLIQEHR